MDGVVLADGETGTLLHDLVQMGDFVSEILDNLPGLFFLFLSLLHEFPSLVNLLPQYGYSLRVLLGKFDGCLDSCSILQDGIV